MAEWVWRIAEPIPDGRAPELEPWPHPLRQLLYNRGLYDGRLVEEFLQPEEVGLHDPLLMRGMSAAVDRVFAALGRGELIGVYGDFDVDGLTAAALLTEVLGSYHLKGRVVSYLPHRAREGYGLNAEAVRRLADAGVGLLITADCGIGADREISLATGLGMDVIVTDHHRVSEGVPPALVVLNPRQECCPYPFEELAGVGVAYKLAEALLARRWDLEGARRRLEPQLDLVALGTVADLAPLLGENRLLVRLGLEQLNRTARPGLRALISMAGLGGRIIDADSIAFGLAPRLNAAGRMGDARLSLELLTCRSDAEAVEMAGLLETANRERQAATSAAINGAREELGRLVELPPAIVLAGDYPAGVVGLVANKLAEEFRRPAFVIEKGETESRGSGRGVAGFDVVRALAESSDLLTRFGGHAQAGGFALPTGMIEAVRARLESSARRQLDGVTPERELFLEASLKLGEIGPALYQWLTMMEPCGTGNPRPLFFSSRAQVRDARVVGGSHLKLWLADESGTSSAIGFGMGTEKYGFVRPGARVDCAYAISRNERNGTVGYEMVLKDLRPSPPRPRGL
jgi:single-stranded-DNA-specific exonuclease